MKKLTMLTLTGLLLSMGSTQMERQLYQVITSHSHDLEKLAPYMETVHESGRLWVVDMKDGTPAELFTFLRPISGREKSYISSPPPAKKQNFDVHSFLIKDTLRKIESEFIKKDVTELSQYTTRAAGTPENREATESVARRFAELGLEVKRICYSEDVCSVVAEKRGSVKPDEVLLALGHLDSVGEEFAGADDNASGTAVLMEMARVLKDYDNHKTIRFFATNGEELGLLGAHHYVKLLKQSGELNNLSLVINMDMVGYNKNGIVELETSPDREPLAKWFAELASKHTKLRTKITLGAWGSDHVPFLNAGLPALLTIEDWSTKTPCYHRSCDKPSTLNYEYAAEIGRLNVAALMAKDRQ